jgi:hypothetical protein
LVGLALSEELQLRKEMIQDLKVQWKRLWHERVNDHWIAEGIANQTYPSLFVDKGTVIRATRDFKALSFREILELHQVPNLARYIQPDPATGGWTKFVKTHITVDRKRRIPSRVSVELRIKVKKGQLKKGGRGWLHKQS